MNIDLSKRTSGEWGTFIQPLPHGLGTTINVKTKRIADLSNVGIEETEANAAYICKAVNNHERLVKALSLSYDYMKELNEVAPGTLNETILNSIQTILNETK